MSNNHTSNHSVELLHIIYCASPDYFQHVAVSAVSAIKNLDSFRVCIHVITCDDGGVEEERLRSSISPFARVQLTVYRASEEKLRGLFVDWRITKESYLRLLAPEIIPTSISKALYLDSDTVVVGDLAPLWRTDLRGQTIAAVPDMTMICIGMQRQPAYVNAGVLLIDLDEWRRKQLTRTMLEYAANHSDWLEYHDQDVINAILRDEILRLDLRWNVAANATRYSRRRLGSEANLIDSARNDPAIIHYVSIHKPWIFRSDAALKQKYFDVLDQTTWRDVDPSLPSVACILEYRLDRALLRFGIDRLRVFRVLGKAPGKLLGQLAGRVRRALRAGNEALTAERRPPEL